MTNEEFKDFVDQYSLLILKVISTVLNKDNEKMYIEDCYSEVLFSIWNKVNEYRGDAKLKNWVATIAKNKAIDFKRKLSKGERLIEKLIDDFKGEEVKGPDDIIVEKFDENKLNSYINELSLKDRDIFRVKYIQELSTAQICERHSLSQEALYMRLSRMKKKLKYIIYNRMEE